MLKKILKYDLENIFKLLIIFYSLSLFFALLTRILLDIENSFIMNIIGQISSGVTISMIFNILINNLMRLWVRFKNNFYGDESYLTHTLPISKNTLYLSKFLTSIITLFTSIFIIGLTLFIAYYSKENIKFLKDLLLPVANIYDTSIMKIIVAFLFIFFLEFANLLQSGFTGIILGHKKNNNKLGYSVLFGFITYILTQIFVLISMFFMGIFNKDIMNLFFTNQIINIDILKTIIYIAILIYTITLLVCYFINLKLFNKGVNVD
ncbi:MAG: hypothetical protein IJ501_01030 [Bacilli bacterium]|nr:hypothetical protein [Bacilli bacterium]